MLSRKFFSLIALFIFSLPLCLYAQTPTPTPTSDDDEVIKVDVAMVNIPVIVSDKQGRRISGLSLENFTLFEDGKPQKIEYLTNQDAPLHIVLLLDTSQSAQEIIDKIKNAAAEFVKQLRPEDKCMIISFDEQARVKTEFTSSQKRMARAIQNTSMNQNAGTLMRDTIFVTVDKELAKVRGRKAVILITDGKDAGSSISQSQLLERLVESDAPIYSIIYETINYLPASSKVQTTQLTQKQIVQIRSEQQKKNQIAAEFLQKVSDVTSGRIFPKEIDNLGDAFKSIAEELRKQYLISFYPEETNYDISKHQIKVKVDRSDVIVRTKNMLLSRSRN